MNNELVILIRVSFPWMYGSGQALNPIMPGGREEGALEESARADFNFR